MKKDYRNVSRVIIYCTGGFALLTIVIFLLNRFPTLDSSLPVNTSLFADYGTLVGGLATAALTIASIYLIIQTINEQQIYFKRNEVEQRIFEFIRLYRENVNEASGKGYEGRNLFIMIRNEILDALDIVQKHLVTDSDYSIDGLKNKEGANIDMAFLLVYHGSNLMTDEYLLKTFQNDYCSAEKARNIISEIKGIYNDIKANNETSKTNPTISHKYLPFDGQQSRLGHYFRHLYQTISFIDNLDDLLYSDSEKYKYVKMLRAQISSHEQAIIFFNSISRLGENWEYADIVNGKKLITKYNLIKNIPNGFTGKVEPQKFYPDVKYENTDRKLV